MFKTCQRQRWGITMLCLFLLLHTSLMQSLDGVPIGPNESDAADLVATVLQPGELSRIEEGDNLVYLSSRAIQALTDVAMHASEKEAPLQEVQDVLEQVDAGFHTAGNAETLLAIKAASLYATEQNVADVTEVLAEYETALAQGEASFVSKRSCPPLLKKECLEVAHLCVKNSCILGNEKICGKLKVGGNINLTKDCPCCPCKSNVVGTVSGAFSPGARVIDSRISLNIDFDFPVAGPDGLVQGCFTIDNPFKNPKASVVNGSGIQVLEVSNSDIKGLVLELNQRTQFAVEFTITIGYPSFAAPPTIACGYNNQQQGAALASLAITPGSSAVMLYNVFCSTASVQQSHAVIRVLFYFEATRVADWSDKNEYSEVLLQLKEIINSSSLSVRIFGFSQ